MRVLWCVLVTACLLASPAWARSRHEGAAVQAYSKGGKPGFKLTVRLNDQDGYGTVLVGLVPRGKANQNTPKDHFRLKERGTLRYQFPATTTTRSQTIGAEWHVIYGEGNDLQPGERLTVVSAWGGSHVWGPYSGGTDGEPASQVDLP